MNWLLASALPPLSTVDLPLDGVWGFLGSQGPPPRHHLATERRRDEQRPFCFGIVWLTKDYGTEAYGFTRKVSWRKWVFDLIDIRLKLVNFELQI